MWYREGTITFTQGSNTLTGTGTFWNFTANGVLPGMIVVGPDNKLYEIKQVLDDTHLTLVEPYSGETQTDVPCRIITTYEGDLTQFSARFAALMTRIYADSKSMRGWLTALDAVTIEREDGTEVTVKPLMQIVNEHNANLEWYKENKEILDASAAGAKKSAESAAASAAAAAESAKQSAASASLASDKANAANASAVAAKSSETVVSEKAAAAEAAKLAAQTAESNAGKQANAAAGSATQAQQYATNAKREADRAQTISNEIGSTTDKFLQKDRNLADVPDKAAARKNLSIERVEQQGETRTVIRGGSESTASYLQVDAGGQWGVYKAGSGWVPLGIAQGGTGAGDAAGARTNLGLGSGNSVEFYNVKANGGVNMANNSGDISPVLVAQVFDSTGAKLMSQLEIRANNNGTAALINRTSGTPYDMTLGSDGMVSTLGLTATRSNASITVKPSSTGDAHYILFNDRNQNTGYVGNPSNSNNDIGLWSYARNAGIQIGDRIRLNGLDTACQGNLFVDGSSVYVRGGDGSANTHVWLQNRSGRTRAVMYSNDNQILSLRSDNAGTGASGQALTINGATGECRATTFTNTSDERAKFWVKPVAGALDKICQLNGVTYSMHTTIQDTVRNAGLIAQDVQKVLPEAVKKGQIGDVLDKNCAPVQDPLTLDYNALSALYVEAFKEVKTEMASMKTEIEALRDEIAALKGETGTPSA
ncbi:tail fiber domain-containing protein [Salmonella enterica]|nr:tail fiber domain-containing protein [Salmonella enterica]EAZ2237938.1 hypothetical protein [Salmonella enterica]